MLRWLRRFFRTTEAPAPPTPLPPPPAPPPAAQERPWRPGWLTSLTGPVLFLDVETTGLGQDDRIVSLGAVELLPDKSDGASIVTELHHLIFDPGQMSHPAAQRVHGHDEWILRHQPFFAEHAAQVHAMLDRAHLIVAHNIEFDLRFIARELAECGLAAPARPTFCTMQAWRERHDGSASLGRIAARLGLRRAGARHGALEDAWFCMAVWLHLRGGLTLRHMPPELTAAPANLLEAPPAPPKPWPRRRRRPRHTPKPDADPGNPA